MLLAGQPTRGDTALHEYGHAIWYQDLSPGQRQAWTEHHQQLLNANRKDPNAPLPQAIRGYADDPAHSFASAFGSYAAHPLDLLRESPATYNLLKQWSGFEYRRGPDWQELQALQNRDNQISQRLHQLNYEGPEAEQLVKESNRVWGRMHSLQEAIDQYLSRSPRK